ncbi:hypothetical protein [Trichlorobacter sp.]|uniref:hypothetical protein n=1 Tax=Trichlorobacter sp. TaxID=2911007 RepID=UPI002A364D2C|nr:hypothetical protein [Trichlorobacter sp.]MDY0384039.1 hypothetical protein [Trichlorobacter sp.]
MYKQHQAFKLPPETTIIWRYMSFGQFSWLIAHENLYFSRLDQHEDGWEGFMPRNWDKGKSRYIRFTKYINCWHMNDSESDAMWKCYGSPYGETVAVKTSVNRLIKSLERSSVPVYIGSVDYSESDTLETNLYTPVLFKRKAFQHEQELRLCISSDSCDNPLDFSPVIQQADALGCQITEMEFLKAAGEKGACVSVELNQFVDEIVLCPNRKPWLKEAVEYVARPKLPHVRITESVISQDTVCNEEGTDVRS